MRNIILQQQLRKKINKEVENNNQVEEIEYFNAYLLPLSEKASIQEALDTYGSIRLEMGDYTGVITTLEMSTSQKIFGHPSLKSQVPNIVIKAGSSGVVIDNVFPVDKTITLESGEEITNCKLKSIKWATLIANNSKLNGNTFINFGGPIRIDCSESGYFRNNKFIKHQTGTVSNLLVMKGNSITPSYGNVHLHTNFLTPHGDTTDIDNLQSTTFVGLDAEGWNLTGAGTKAMFKASNMGKVKLTDLGGGNDYSAVRTGAYDIDASDIFMLNKKLRDTLDKISLRSNMNLVNGIDGYIRDSGTVTGFDLESNLNDSRVIKYNNVIQDATISDPVIISKLTNSILGTEYTPWTKPNWNTLPDPLGTNWRTNRIGKPDSTSYIQNLIDTNGIAELPEGIFYIGSTLFLPLDRNHGIMGKGTAKTVIVTLTDDFPLITLTGGQDDNFVLAHLTLQGGITGVYSSQNFGTQHMSFLWLKYVIFRDQTNGFHLDKIIGFDNNFFDNVSFVNCNIGFYQDPLKPYDNNPDTSSFVDKTMFYRSQFINCNTSVSMKATRADNLNAWVDCKFNNGETALMLTGNNFPIIANSDFTEFSGNHLIETDEISIYNSTINNNNNSISTIKSLNSYIEGCDFKDNTRMFSSIIYNPVHANIINSTIEGNIDNLAIDGDWNSNFSSILMNSNLKSNLEISKLLVNIKDNVSTILINEESNPYPQLLVTQ